MSKSLELNDNAKSVLAELGEDASGPWDAPTGGWDAEVDDWEMQVKALETVDADLLGESLNEDGPKVIKVDHPNDDEDTKNLLVSDLSKDEQAEGSDDEDTKNVLLSDLSKDEQAEGSDDQDTKNVLLSDLSKDDEAEASDEPKENRADSDSALSSSPSVSGTDRREATIPPFKPGVRRPKRRGSVVRSAIQLDIRNDPEKTKDIPVQVEGLVANEFDDYGSFEPTPRVALDGVIPTDFEEDDAGVPSVVAALPDVMSGPLLAVDGSDEDLPDDLPTPVLVPKTAAHTDLPGLIESDLGGQVETYDQPIQLSRPPRPRARSSVTRRPPGRPASMATPPPPPKFDKGSNGAWLFAVAACLVAVAAYVALPALEDPAPSGTAIGQAPAAKRITVRPKAPQLKLAAAEPTESEDPIPASQRFEILDNDGDDEAARRAYGRDDADRSSLGAYRDDPTGKAEPTQALTPIVRRSPSAPYLPSYFSSDDPAIEGEQDTTPSQAPYLFGAPEQPNLQAAGLLVVNVIPWGNVYIDDRGYGYPPVSVRALPVGRHVIRVERPGFETVTRVVNLEKDRNVRVHIRLGQR